MPPWKPNGLKAPCGGAAGGLTKHSHIGWVTTERTDIAFHPFQRGQLIQETEVRAWERWVREEAQGAEPVVE